LTTRQEATIHTLTLRIGFQVELLAPAAQLEPAIAR
jgi:hypothetical protein